MILTVVENYLSSWYVQSNSFIQYIIRKSIQPIIKQLMGDDTFNLRGKAWFFSMFNSYTNPPISAFLWSFFDQKGISWSCGPYLSKAHKSALSSLHKRLFGQKFEKWNPPTAISTPRSARNWTHNEITIFHRAGWNTPTHTLSNDFHQAMLVEQFFGGSLWLSLTSHLPPAADR